MSLPLRHNALRLNPTAGLLALMLGAFFSAAAQAAGPVQLASIQGDGKRFIPLNYARSAVASAKVVAPRVVRQSGLHSDVQSMQRGFMRIDRNTMVINVKRTGTDNYVPMTRPTASAAPVADAPTAQAQTDNPVLDLFGGDDVAGKPVFGRTFRGANVRGHAWPLAQSAKQYVSSGYGMRTSPFGHKQEFHGGVDIAAPTGTPVLATADGVVASVGRQGGFGNSITIRHRDGSQSRYSHLSAESVREGQMVRQGQQIGQVGSTGRSTGSHLDYRISMNGQSIDPMRVLARNMPNSVRLAQADIRR